MLGGIKLFLKYLKTKQKLKKQGSKLRSWHLGENVSIGNHCNISKRVTLSDNVSIGDFTYLNSDKYWITLESNVSIGKYCSIAPGVHIGAGNHDHALVTTHPILFNPCFEGVLGLEKGMQRANGLIDKDKCTFIGHDVWIGLRATIKRGVKIGNGAIIAGGSVVVKDVPDYAIVGGNPAKIIKYRTSAENIESFQQNEDKMWWNWDNDTLKENFASLYDFETYKKFF